MKLAQPKQGPRCEECPLYEAGIPVADFRPLDYHGLSLVGEMPGRMEVRTGSCFSGPSGKLLDACLEFNSLTRENIHLTNAVRCGLTHGLKPDDDDDNRIQKKAAECCRPILMDNLEAIGAKVVCNIGAVAWNAMTGFHGIDKYRGTVIVASDDVPWHTGATVHPAGLLKVEARRLRVSLLIADLYKYYMLAVGREQIWDPVVKDPNDFEGLVEFLRMHQDVPMSIDVETDSIDALTANLHTIGVAAKSKQTGIIESWPIPYQPAFPGFYTQKQWAEIYGLLEQALFSNNAQLVFHNMTYDVPVLENHFNREITASCHDTVLLHHAVYPKLPHNLQEVASQFLCVEPWKTQFRSSEKELDKITEALEEGYEVHMDFANGQTLTIEESDTTDDILPEDPGDTRRVIRSVEELNDLETSELFYYNGCDCVATLELYYRLMAEAKQLDVMRVYEGDRELSRYAIHWYYTGVGINEGLRKQLEVEYAADLEELLAETRALCSLPPKSERDKLLAPLEREMADTEELKRLIRLSCPYCEKEGTPHETKGAPDLCRHIVKLHTETAIAFAEQKGVDWESERNPVEQTKLLYEATRACQLEDIEQADGEIKELRKKIKAVKKLPCTETFNPASPIQLRAALKERGLTPTKLTKKTQELSTSKDSLWDLRDDPFVDILFKYRTKAKLFSTYIVGLPNKLGLDGRLHPVWKIFATPSGRYGTRPAIQNWPPDMRVMIVPEKGYVIVGADYANLELRISALLAGQLDLIEAFLQNADIHAKHAGIFFPTVWPELNQKWLESADSDDARDELVPLRKKIRNRGKAVTFGKVYRGGDQVLYEVVREQRLDVKTPEQHKQLFQEVAAMSAALDNAYPNITEWAEIMHRIAEENLMLRTALSRRMRVWPMGEVPLTESSNHPIQGLAADTMNEGTLRLIHNLEKAGLYRTKAWIIMQIHDAIYLEVAEEHAVQVARMVEESLRTELTLPSIVTGQDHYMLFPAEAEIGYNAKELHSVKRWENEYKGRSITAYAS